MSSLWLLDKHFDPILWENIFMTICFPNASSDSNSETERRFSFSLSNVDADGPQGSFECIRQTRRGMESLGNMHYKMQIHASEDSYQKTKARMAVAEQESKKNCTKVIKDSGPNVGRKIKVKKVFSQNKPGFPNPPPTNSPPLLKLNGTSINNKTNATVLSNGIANKASPISYQANSDIMRRPLKDRVIHLLALRPYKKPELIARLNKDGIREKDKKGLSVMLSQIANLKDNSYHLARHAWPDVQTDDWPFYSNEERELVRRRNPLLGVQPQHSSALNTTLSPLSSDCSSLQDSPSPPNLMNLSVNSPSSHPAKRAIESASNTLKRQRTSHIHQQHLQTHSRPKSPNANFSTSAYSDVLNGWANKPKSPETSKTSQQMAKNPMVTGNVWNYSNGTSDHRPDSQLSSNKSLNYLSPDSNGIALQSQSANQSVSTHLTNGFSNNAINNASKKAAKNGHNIYRNGSSASNIPSNFVNSNAFTNESVCSTPNSSPDSGTGSNDGSTTSSRSLSSTNGETPDYFQKYTEITNDEQRAKYKSDFNSEYAEYRNLWQSQYVVEKKFSDLEHEMKRAPEGSDEWNRIMDQIIKEYEETKRDPKFNEQKKRFSYLHGKLSHIKKLVMDYDKQFPEREKRAARLKKSKRLTS
ncbi:elongation factor RNA polymerase II-like protein [Dinothrombium tinctorium]|uniref:Elongation factor RNA polymerase II-like protein n=1 Tax=Dinothrombium tinctorium TaxID=1965070 RepID=A0A3S3QWX3_9ACAR|nr:elongation factor RNA polymerase II-like protein [Dinothrombium tinctorium]